VRMAKEAVKVEVYQDSKSRLFAAVVIMHNNS
jgi:hypothetical protein